MNDSYLNTTLRKKPSVLCSLKMRMICLSDKHLPSAHHFSFLNTCEKRITDKALQIDFAKTTPSILKVQTTKQMAYRHSIQILAGLV